MKSINQKITEIVQHFAPGWFASVMGTAVIVIAAFVLREYIPYANEIQAFFLAVSFLLSLVLLIPWSLRWLKYPEAVRRDLAHPVSAAFFPTMPISLVIFGIALEKVPLPFLPEAALWGILQVLWVLGAAGILILALTIFTTFFHQPEIRWEASSLGWLIPPVSALIVPVLGSSLAGHFHGSALGPVYMFGSLIFLGIGGILFLMVMTVSLARYIFYALPPIHLAPTLWVGIAPTSILTIIILRLNTPLQAYLSFSDPTAETLHVIAKISGTGLWGFALFWLFLAAIVTLELHRTNPLPFALSWWAFVFPVGAFTVASGVLYQAMPVAFFLWTGLASFVVLVAFWLIIFSHTLRGIWQGSIFIPHSSK